MKMFFKNLSESKIVFFKMALQKIMEFQNDQSFLRAGVSDIYQLFVRRFVMGLWNLARHILQKL